MPPVLANSRWRAKTNSSKWGVNSYGGARPFNERSVMPGKDSLLQMFVDSVTAGSPLESSDFVVDPFDGLRWGHVRSVLCTN